MQLAAVAVERRPDRDRPLSRRHVGVVGAVQDVLGDDAAEAVANDPEIVERRRMAFGHAPLERRQELVEKKSAASGTAAASPSRREHVEPVRRAPVGEPSVGLEGRNST